MKRFLALLLDLCAALLAGHGVVRGQDDVFTLSIEAPASLGGSAGSTQSTTAYARLKHEGSPPGHGAQGWSYGIVAEDCRITSVTVAGTMADTIPNGGYRDPEGSFNKTQIVDPAKNGGRGGVVSAIALTYLFQYQFQPSTAPNPHPPPPAPFPDCGRGDPTDDATGCAESQSSCP
jgi:hypothetical protein